MKNILKYISSSCQFLSCLPIAFCLPRLVHYLCRAQHHSCLYLCSSIYKKQKHKIVSPIEMEEEVDIFEPMNKYSPIPVCKCIKDDWSESDKVEMTDRKLRVLSIVPRTEEYLQERRIPELIRFLLTKVIAHSSDNPTAFLEKLLNDCMLFRAGHGNAPVLFEDRHLKAVVKSFDPGSRGWLTSGQIRRAFTTLGLNVPHEMEDRMTTEEVLNLLNNAQKEELYSLLSAGQNNQPNECTRSCSSATSTSI